MEQNLQAFLIFSIVAAAAWRIAIAILKRRRRKFLACLHPIKDAHTLTTHTLYVEFACLRRMSVELGLLRTFAIPAISRLLHKSREMLHRPSKRYDDTDILVQELMHHHVDSERGSVALRRLNFLHGQYRIENQEYIYVLAVFVLLPQDWAMRYGHRSFTEAESCAYYTVWRDVGTRMGIRDIPGSLEALRSFMEEYEAKNMVYSESNKAVAEANMELFLGSYQLY